MSYQEYSLEGESYPMTELQSAYSTAPPSLANWMRGLEKRRKGKENNWMILWSPKIKDLYLVLLEVFLVLFMMTEHFQNKYSSSIFLKTVNMDNYFSNK